MDSVSNTKGREFRLTRVLFQRATTPRNRHRDVGYDSDDASFLYLGFGLYEQNRNELGLDLTPVDFLLSKELIGCSLDSPDADVP